MKFFIVALAFVAAASALPQQRQLAEEKPIAILRQAQDISPEGAYQYNYETENGIQASENGAAVALGPKGEVGNSAQGSYKYTAPDGTPISVSYSANEHGFQPEGAHLPVAPAIPEQIQRALDYIAAHPQKPENQH